MKRKEAQRSPKPNPLLRGGIVNRTYRTRKNLYIYLFLLTIYGPSYYGTPYQGYIDR